MNHIIYGIKVNGEYLYIGSTKDLNRRKSQHKNKINNPPKKNKELYEFLKDKEFTYDILHETEDKKERFIKEHELAMKYKSKYNKQYAKDFNIIRRTNKFGKIVEYKYSKNKYKEGYQNKYYQVIKYKKMIKYFKEHGYFSTHVYNQIENDEINPVEILMITYQPNL